jgi:hypothetical protein
MTSVDRTRAATIATGEPRFMAIFFTLIACVIAGGWVQETFAKFDGWRTRLIDLRANQ